MNVLSNHRKTTIRTLLERGLSHREVARVTGAHRATVRRYAMPLAKCTSPATGSGAETGPPRPPAFIGEKAIESACEPYREWIEKQVALGRNARAIHQELIERHGFPHRYNAVKRFVRKLRVRAPERYDVLDFLPGEEAQVDYGMGAPTLPPGGKYHKRPRLFVMTLKYSGKCFRKVVWNSSQETWAKLHEEAFRAFGGCPRYVVLDNLKEGVITPDLYEPELNRVYAAMLAHYGVVAQPCRPRDPNRKGTVERAIQHTQDTALKGCKYESIEKQNEWLARWEERYAAPRIHGSKKRQVLAMYLEEKPHLLPLPAAGFRYFAEEERMVDDAGLVQVKGSYYSALPAPLHAPVKVRIYDDEIVILDRDGAQLRRHDRARRKGIRVLPPEDRIFNPSRDTAILLHRAAKIGPRADRLAQTIFARDGRAGQGTIYGLVNLTRNYPKEDIDAACGQVLDAGSFSYRAIKNLLQRAAKKRGTPQCDLRQQGPEIRPMSDYQSFWDLNARGNSNEEEDNGYVGS